MNSETTNWNMDSIRQDMVERFGKLPTKTSDELLNDLIDMSTAIYPFVLMLSYFIDNKADGIFVATDMFPEHEWSFDPSGVELAEEFELLQISANYDVCYDMGGTIEVQNVKFLKQMFDKIVKGTTE